MVTLFVRQRKKNEPVHQTDIRYTQLFTKYMSINGSNVAELWQSNGKLGPDTYQTPSTRAIDSSFDAIARANTPN